ncbi:hypothetical protein ACFQ9H_19445 [Streptomyces sp. NPDC056517]|uniref:hypothetical protein n=1 Tax=Streptomyces sp. NPDC056517 TaxID=3345848 RepID=UPI003694D6EA
MSTVGEVRGVTRGVRPALAALVSGSMVLGGKLCGCGSAAVRWAWDQASIDGEATAAAQTRADLQAKASAAKGRKKSTAAEDDDQDESEGAEPEVTAPPVAPVRRPAVESLGMLALGGVLAAGALGTIGALVWPYAQLLAPWRGVIATVGGLAWMAAAWMLAPPTAPVAVDVEEQDESADQEDPAPQLDRGMALLLHVIRDLSDAEYSKRSGVHLDVLLDSATAAGHVPPGTEQATFRAWLTAAGLPTEDKLGMRIEGKPVTRVGVRIDAATRVLGMTPTALLQAREPAPVPAPAEVPIPAAPQPSAPAVLRLIPGGLLDPSSTPPLASPRQRAQGAR